MRRSAALLLLAPVLQAQPTDTWAQIVERRLASGRGPVVSSFALFYPKALNGPWLTQDEFVRLRTSGELGLPMLEEAEDKALKAQMAWGGEARWILISPKGEALGNGTEAPTVDRITGLMKDAGWHSRWDMRAAFLREHAGSGDAWSDELREQAWFAARQAAQQSGGKAIMDLPPSDPDGIPTDPAQDEAHWGPMAKALHGLMDVDGWADWGPLGFVVTTLRVGGAKGSGLLKPEFEKLRRDVEGALRRHPSSQSLWSAWSTAAAMGDVGDPEALLASLEPAPGEAWPPAAASDALGDALTSRQDWAGLERLASLALARGLAPEMLAGKNARETRGEVLEAWLPLRIRALLHLDRLDDACAAAAEARTLVGRRWHGIANSMRAEAIGVASEAAADPSTGKASKAETPPKLAEILDRSLMADPGKPALPPPLTLALLGEPAWGKAFVSLKTSSAFDSWEPNEELMWGTVDAKRAQALRIRKGWGPEARWVLLRGDELLDSGTELPETRALADRVRAQGIPLLEALNAFLRRHPEHLDARQARLEALCSRMPNQRLEVTLLEDAKALRGPFLDSTPFESEKWKPMAELWEPAAQRLLPELEADLRAWPEDADRWAAYADWSDLHPRRPSPADLLSTLPVWKTRMKGGAGPLPDEVGMAVAGRLKRQGRWEPLVAWGRAFWRGGLRDRLIADAAAPRKRRGLFGDWAELEQKLVLPYREALVALQRSAELQGLDEDLRTVKGALPPPPQRGRGRGGD